MQAYHTASKGCNVVLRGKGIRFSLRRKLTAAHEALELGCKANRVNKG